MKLKDLESWLTPTDAARPLTEGGNRISRQAIEKRLNDGKYQADNNRQGWMIEHNSMLCLFKSENDRR